MLLGVRGSGRYLLDHAEASIAPGTMIWAASGVAHMLLEAGAGFDMWVVVAHPKLWPGVALVPMDAGTGRRQLGPEAAAELAGLAEVVAGLAPLDRGTGLRWWLTRARHLWEAAAETPVAHWHPAVARAAFLLDADATLSVPDLARAAGLSEAQLGRLFRAQTGQTVTGFRNARRLAAVDDAVVLGRPLLNAALEAGFGSYSQFFRVFQAQRGCAPRDWYRV